ncbi:MULTISPECIES: hypothetical protein [unclassified Pedobacter]|uniref:hypothetical protein n=1 Tax=unclassified Pedobacter TaxID=2628915 RepID=UPI001E337256|nr:MULTISPECIES: hypothetical protein [unclassified Pedobacter]
MFEKQFIREDAKLIDKNIIQLMGALVFDLREFKVSIGFCSSGTLSINFLSSIPAKLEENALYIIEKRISGSSYSVNVFLSGHTLQIPENIKTKPGICLTN